MPISRFGKKITRKRKERIIKTANLIIKHEYTTREAAKVIGVSRSTISRDMQDLYYLDLLLFAKVGIIFADHTLSSYSKGGQATKKKWAKIRKEKKKCKRSR